MKNTHLSYIVLDYSRKNPNRGGVRGCEDIEFPGVIKKEHVKIPGVN